MKIKRYNITRNAYLLAAQRMLTSNNVKASKAQKEFLGHF